MRGFAKALLLIACALLVTSASAITISKQPTAAVINAGSTAKFAVATTNGTPTAYQWFLGTKPLQDGITNGAIISGSQTATLTIENVGMNLNAGLFKVAISNSAAPVFSVAVRLTVLQGTLIKFNTGLGPITVELFDHDKPVTVQNFLRYALGGPNSGAYVNTFFSRLEPDFVLQGGGFAPFFASGSDPFTNEYYIPDAVFSAYLYQQPGVPKFIVNESQRAPHVRNTFGTLAMATISGYPDSARSEWFFNLNDNSSGTTNLDTINGGYTVFGRTVSGMDVLTNFNNLPGNQIISHTVTDSSFGTKTFPTLPTTNASPGNVSVSNLFFPTISVVSRPVVDLTPPSGRITYPPANAKLTNGTFTLRGTATDNIGVSSIICVSCLYLAIGPDPLSEQIAGGITAVGTTNWSADLNLHPGPWNLKFRIYDGHGNWTTVSVSVVITDPLTVQTVGNGRVSPNYNGQFLAPQSKYSMTAFPGTGQLFAGWTAERNGQTWNFPYGTWRFIDQVVDGHTNSVLSGPSLGTRVMTPTLGFYMYSNLTITANFVSNYFPVVQGTYYGLIAPTDHNSINVTNAGLCKIVSSSLGTYSGTMSIQGRVWPFAGKWDYTGNSTVSIPRPGMSNLLAHLTLDLSNNLGMVTGTVSSVNWTSDITTYRAVTKLTTNSTPVPRNYVMKIPSQNSDLGDSFATLTVSSTGLLTFAGTMADNTPWTESVGIGRDGNFPIFASLYAGRGLVIGLQQFATPTNSIGATRWIRPAISNAYYTNGFSTPAFFGYIDAFIKPPVNSTYNLRLGGNTLPEVSFGLQTAATGQLVVTSGPTNRPRLTLTLTTGALVGTWTDSNKGVWTLRGIFESPTAGGTGFILGPHGQTGYLHIDPL